MGAVLWFARREVRGRWRAVVGLALLIGVAGSVVLATAAGARRTATSYDRLLDVTHTRDVSVQIDDVDPDPVLSRLEALDLVERSGRAEIIPALPTSGGIETDVDLALFASPDGRWAVDIDRPVILAGRMPDPASTDEVLLNELAARRMGLAPGDSVSLATFTPEQLQTLHHGGQFSGFGGPEVTLRVVGVGRQATDLQGADESSGGVLLVSPALRDELSGRAGSMTGLLAVDLAAGATVADLRNAVRDLMGPTGEFDVQSADEEFGSSTRQAVDVLARALWVFAVVAAVASVVAVGGAVARQSAAARTAEPVLSALGAGRRHRALALAAVPVSGAVLGTVAAIGGAALASSRFPISVARRVEPAPGPRLDPLVLGAGGVLLLIAGLAWIAVVASRDARPGTVGTARGRRWLALPPVAAIGLGHAFETRSEGRSIPARAAIGAATLGVVGVVAAATVATSFDDLVEDPARYGWAWSSEPDFYAEDPEALVAELTSTEGIAGVAFRHNARLELDGRVVEAVAFDPRLGTIDPPLRAGRLPADDREIAIGQHTADDLGAGIGDRIPVRTADGSAEVDLEVVGIAVLALESANPANGAVVTPAGLERFERSDGFTSLLLDYEPGFDPATLEASLLERELADFSLYSRPRLPGGLENLDRAMPIVTALGAFFAVLAVLGVGHAVVVGARRRRRELATLRALGMHRQQVRRVVTVHAVATVIAGLVLGVPLGLVAGRSAWRLVIEGQGVVDQASTPLLALLAVAPVAVVLAVAVSWWPGARASRSTVVALRAE